MWCDDFTDNCFGTIVPTVGGVKAFFPNDLPPELAWTPELSITLSDADQAIGQLNGVGLNLPNAHLLIRPFIRREAVLSSRIEGTLADISDLYLYEEDHRVEVKVSDVREVSNYVRALEYGLERQKTLPMSLRFIRELHERLMESVRGKDQMPGQFRTTQNMTGPVGGTVEQATYIPPPPQQMEAALATFEKFLHDRSHSIPTLVRLAMVHYQFEAIHPFRDGNGRIGRLLITLLLCMEGVLSSPLLYLSAYFERHRQDYYAYLRSVSSQGKWTEWILFFLRGVTEQSKDAFERSRQLLSLQQQYHHKLHDRKRSASQFILVDHLFMSPVITTKGVEQLLGVTVRSAQRNINTLIEVGILKQYTAGQRYRIYVAKEILDIIEKPSSLE